MNIISFDSRRNIVIPGDKQATINYSCDHFIKQANASIQDHGYFAVALSGGSTPKAIYEKIAEPENRDKIDWSRVKLFWGDERAVPADHPDSNYHMAMTAAFNSLPVPKKNIFHMKTQGYRTIEEAALTYEGLIKQNIPNEIFDLVMLGVGEDGHTASLFPHTKGLEVRDHLVTANYVQKLNTWRLSLTFNCINEASSICLYVLGQSKSAMVAKIFSDPISSEDLPSQAIGTPTHKALWILDTAAAEELKRQKL